jgi:hypothetical protein
MPLALTLVSIRQATPTQPALFVGQAGPHHRVEFAVPDHALVSANSLTKFSREVTAGLFEIAPVNASRFRRELKKRQAPEPESNRVEFTSWLSTGSTTAKATSAFRHASTHSTPAPSPQRGITAEPDGSFTYNIGRFAVKAAPLHPSGNGGGPINLSVHPSRRAHLLSRTALGRRVLESSTTSS